MEKPRKVKQVKITSMKTGKSFIFNTQSNISEAVLKKQKNYDKWRRNKRENKYYDYFEIMEEGNYKSEYVKTDF